MQLLRDARGAFRGAESADRDQSGGRDSGALSEVESLSDSAHSGPTRAQAPLLLAGALRTEAKFRITEYFRGEFRGLRELFEIDDAQFYHSLGSSRFLQTSGGKSNSDFMVTVDGKVR